MNEKTILALEIIGWGLIGVVVLFVLLKLVGIIHSPMKITLNTLVTTGILALMMEMRVKLGLLWSECKKRKEI